MSSKKQGKQQFAPPPVADLPSSTPAHPQQHPPSRSAPTIAEPVKWFAHHFEKDCRMFFKDAPLAFAGAVVLVAVAVWFASSSWHLQIIRDKESIIATKDATISAQADENKRLKEKVAEYQKSEPKKEHIVGDISPAGQERIVEKLKVAYQPNYIIHIRPLAADPKSIRLTATLAKVFEASGYNLVRGTPAGDLIKEPFPGLKVVSANNLSDSLSHALDQIFAELGQGMNVYERDTTWNTNIVVLYLGFPN